MTAINSKKILRNLRKKGLKLKQYLPLIILIPTFSFGIFALYRFFTSPMRLKVAASDSTHLYTANSETLDIFVGKKDSNQPTITLKSNQNSLISFTLSQTNPDLEKPIKKGNLVTFPNVRQGVDLVYQTLPNGIKEEIILTKRGQGNSFAFDTQIHGANPKMITNEFLGQIFYDQDDNYLFHFEKPYAVDDAGARTDDVILNIRRQERDGNLYKIIVTVPLEWLNSPDRVYPISIDPTVIHDTSSEFSPGQLNRVKDTGTGSVPSLETYYQELPADEHTIGLWHMNEGTDNTCTGGEDACDSSDNNNHGTATNTTVGVDGIMEKARNFAGADYITLNNDIVLNTSDSYTLSLWFNTSEWETYRNGTAFMQGTATGNFNGVFYYNGDTDTLTIEDDSGNVRQVSPFVLDLDTWYNLAVTITPSGIQFYLNGQTAGAQQSAFTDDFTIDLIGKGYGSDPYHHGSIDEVRISNIARTPEEIKAAASRRPSSVYTSDVIDLTDVTSWTNLSWDEWGVATGDGETLYSSTGLVAQWNFNETSGTTANNDAEGSSCGGTPANCDGTLSGFDSTASQDADPDSSWTANNKRWGVGGLQFDGVDSYVSVSDDSSLQFGSSDEFSISMWIKSNDYSDIPVFVGKRDVGGTNYQIYHNSGELRFYDGSTETSFNEIDLNDHTGEWLYIAYTHNSSDEVSAYVNGKLLSTHSVSVSVDDAPLYIGSLWSSNYFNGTIDSTRIYSRALPAHEILSNYNATNIEFQTRVGTDTSPDDGSWDAWSSVSGETTIDSFDGPFQYNTTDSGLVAYWPMDETSDNTCSGGEDTCDYKGDNHGTATGTTIVDGVYGKGRGFDGSSDYVSVTDTTDSVLDVTDNLTIETWIKHDTTGVWDGILQKGSTASSLGLYEMHIINTDVVRVILNNDSTNASVTGTTTINKGQWYHVVATYDKSNLRLYINGVLDNTDAYTTSIGTDNNPLNIGLYYNTSSYLFDGSIDEVKIYNTTLSAATIQQHYLEGSTNPNMLHSSTATTSGEIFIEGDSSEKIETGRPLLDAHTVALWHLDETNGDNAGDDIFDATSNNNDGEFNGTNIATAVVDGVSGKARVFNGTDDYIEFGDVTMLDGNNEATISVWIKPDTLPSSTDINTILAKADYSGNNAFFIRLRSTEGIRFQVNDGANSINCDTTTSPSANTWTLITAVLDSSDNCYVYFNDKQQVTNSNTSFTTIQNTTTTLKVGASNYGSELYFDGSIDEVRISDMARSAEEIAEAYRSGRDHYLNKTITSTDLSSKSTLPFWIAADRPGTYLDAIIGESPYANYQPDTDTVGLWHLDDFRYKDSSGNGNDGMSSLYGIDYGIRSSNLTLIANQWGGAANSGEMDITCTGGDSACEIVTMDGTTISTPSINNGVAMDESTVRTAYIMYSPSLSGQGITPYTNNSNNYIGIRYNSGWEYDRNGAWYSFTANGSNIIIASLTQGAPTTTNLVQLNNHSTPTQGKIGKARNFNGTSDYIDTNYKATGLTAMTFEAWINLATLPSVAAKNFDIFSTIDASSTAIIYYLDTSNHLTLFHRNGGTNPGVLAGTKTFTTNKWYHIAITLENNGTNNDYVTYVNGEVDISQAYGEGETIARAINFYLGARSHYSSATDYFFDGQIDEVRISNIARTASEIRQAYEVGLRTHSITIDFAASLDSGNLITGSGDTSFTVDATAYGLDAKGSALYKGDKIIIRETVDDTEYIAQGTVTAVTTSTGAVTVASWDSGSTFHGSGYTANASVFKWQREYWPVANNTLSTHMDAITNLTFRLTNGNEGRTIWLDDLLSNSSYLTDKTGSTIPSSTGNQYFQYRAIMTSLDEAVSATLSAVTIDYVSNSVPNTPSLDLPTNTDTDQPLLPVLKTTTTDGDSNYLRYKIDVCENVDMSTNCNTYTQTAGDQTGWSGQNAETSTAYTSGTQATYTLQSDLTTNFTYYWRSYAIDPGGTNTWSSTQGTPYSFTTIATPTITGGCRIQETRDDSSLTIIWTDTATNEDGYEVQRSVDAATWSVLITGLATNSTSHQDSTITTSHTYRYRIAPYLTAGPSYGDWCYTDTLTQNLGTFQLEGLNLEGFNLN